ncbi:DUF1656 domain-containing protein [Janthinobacterium sp.]|uniref:DUF1656 domain-containing protein n=1 Tax=Janthinobacterium sp. TaxID=1871054 RepID=UPI0028A2B517|nr:DUF1656 domain-containing protein [Janthinobacterium sp.]
MIAEISLYGLYVPSLLLLCVTAAIVTRVLGRLFMRVGLYRLVWHPALFEFALFLIVLSGLFQLLKIRGY